MRFCRASRLVAAMFLMILWSACGAVYRPVVIPTTLTPPNPASFHTMFALNSNVNNYPGTAMQIDVSGDSIVAETANDPTGQNVGVNPTHAVSLPNNSLVFVASAGSIVPGIEDDVAAFSPASDTSLATGFGTVDTYSLPSGSLPVFVATTQNTAVYVANFGTNTVSVINPVLNVISQTVPVGAQPVVLSELPNATKLYVVDQGNATTPADVRSLSTTDMSTVTTIGLNPSTVPAWAAMREDGQRFYVVTQGDGNLFTIRTDLDTIIPGSPQSVGGPGANFISYDDSLNRLYVVNPTASKVYVFDATTDPPTPIGPAAGLTISAPRGVAGIGPVIPTGVAALPDGSRFYVASYVVATGACPDANTPTAGCVIPQVTVFNASTFAVETTVFPLLTPATSASGAQVQPYAISPVTSCAPVSPYAPGVTRYRFMAAAAADSTRVYVAMCDAGSIAVINTTTSSIDAGVTNPIDDLALDLNAPFGAGVGSNGQPVLQNPNYIFTGQ